MHIIIFNPKQDTAGRNIMREDTKIIIMLAAAFASGIAVGVLIGAAYYSKAMS